jgi:hypothetical protein
VRCQIDMARADMREVVAGMTRSSDACHATPRGWNLIVGVVMHNDGRKPHIGLRQARDDWIGSVHLRGFLRPGCAVAVSDIRRAPHPGPRRSAQAAGPLELHELTGGG